MTRFMAQLIADQFSELKRSNGEGDVRFVFGKTLAFDLWLSENLGYRIIPTAALQILPIPENVVSSLVFYRTQYDTLKNENLVHILELCLHLDPVQKAMTLLWFLSQNIPFSIDFDKFEEAMGDRPYHEYVMWRRIRPVILDYWSSLAWKVFDKDDLQPFKLFAKGATNSNLKIESSGSSLSFEFRQKSQIAPFRLELITAYLI